MNINHSSAKTGVEELIHRFRDTEKFIVYCKECNRYNACWACPPFDFDTGEYLLSHPTAYIVGTKITLDEDVIKHNQGREQTTKISYEILGDVRRRLDDTLLKMEKQYPESKAFFAGACRICPLGECTRIAGKACISPEKIRPSLEALGFDVSRISAEILNIEMQWSRDGVLPAYFTLVSGFFTNHEITGFDTVFRTEMTDIPAVVSL